MRLRPIVLLFAIAICVGLIAALASFGRSAELQRHVSRAPNQQSWEKGHAQAIRALTTPVGPDNSKMKRSALIGRTVEGRRIWVRQYGDPKLPGVLVFGCIHGTECAASDIDPADGCPAIDSNIHLVRDLDPDGFAAGIRLNGRGVDLNRNFPAGWKPIGSRGSPQYSGPHPFSEPETRIAAHLIDWLRPRATIWFHQHSGRALVRAWGPSVRLARRYANRADLPFKRLPWPAGTAPNWQNHRFAGSASFVVELPFGDNSAQDVADQGASVYRFAHWIAHAGG